MSPIRLNVSRERVMRAVCSHLVHRVVLSTYLTGLGITLLNSVCLQCEIEVSSRVSVCLWCL